MNVNLVSNKGTIYTKAVREKGAEENICTEEAWNNRKLQNLRNELHNLYL
jgi:hypothetical protein